MIAETMLAPLMFVLVSVKALTLKMMKQELMKLSSMKTSIIKVRLGGADPHWRRALRVATQQRELVDLQAKRTWKGASERTDVLLFSVLKLKSFISACEPGQRLEHGKTVSISRLRVFIVRSVRFLCATDVLLLLTVYICARIAIMRMIPGHFIIAACSIQRHSDFRHYRKKIVACAITIALHVCTLFTLVKMT